MEPRGVGDALGGLATGWALTDAGPESPPAVGGGRTGQHSSLPVALVPHTESFPGQPGGQVWGASGAWGPRVPGPRGGGSLTS